MNLLSTDERHQNFHICKLKKFKDASEKVNSVQHSGSGQKAACPPSKDNKAVQETEERNAVSVHEPENVEGSNDDSIGHRSLRKNPTLSHKRILEGG